MSSGLDAVVIGSGPNGLAAAVTLALAGRSVTVFEAAETIGGGLRSDSLGNDGFVHDLCSAVHPFGVASPFFRSLADQGLLPDLWRYAEVEIAHPLDGGRAALSVADLDATAAGFGERDGATYRRLVGPVVDRLDEVFVDVLRPAIGWPRSPASFASYALRAPWPFTWLPTLFAGDEAPALLAGCAGHSITALHRPLTSAVAVLFAASAHGRRWPLVAGGSQQLADALAAIVTDRGGEINLGTPVTSLDQLPAHRVAFFDTNPAQIADIAGSRLADAERRAFGRFRHGPGVFKIDYTLSEPVPWANEGCRRALTLHLGGTASEVVEAERDVAAGRHPDAPFVLAAQPVVADPSRAPAGEHVLWAYTHVPAFSTVDMTAAIERQIERFAPGFGDVVTSRTVTDTAALAARNRNLIGGDIGGGSMAGLQLVFRPRPSLHPYATSNPGIFICSASAPPGAGVHGMAGHLAARRALDTVLR